MTSQIVAEKTKKWIEKFVLKHDLCPFAHKPWHEGRLHFVVSLACDWAEVVIDLAQEIEHLRTTPLIELSNTFLILPLLPAKDFAAFYGDIQSYAEEEQLEDVQLVTFHPRYQFHGVGGEDRANFVNRSPYPMIHLLRNVEFAAVFRDNADLGEQISIQNEKKLVSLSDNEWAEVLELLRV